MMGLLCAAGTDEAACNTLSVGGDDATAGLCEWGLATGSTDEQECMMSPWFAAVITAIEAAETESEPVAGGGRCNFGQFMGLLARAVDGSIGFDDFAGDEIVRQCRGVAHEMEAHRDTCHGGEEEHVHGDPPPPPTYDGPMDGTACTPADAIRFTQQGMICPFTGGQYQCEAVVGTTDTCPDDTRDTECGHDSDSCGECTDPAHNCHGCDSADANCHEPCYTTTDQTTCQAAGDTWCQGGTPGCWEHHPYTQCERAWQEIHPLTPNCEACFGSLGEAAGDRFSECMAPVLTVPPCPSADPTQWPEVCMNLQDADGTAFEPEHCCPCVAVGGTCPPECDTVPEECHGILSCTVGGLQGGPVCPDLHATAGR